MSTNVSSVTKHFPSAENGFTTTLESTVSAGATTVPLNSVAGYTNGEVAVFVVDPTNLSKKQTFTGTIDTSGVQVTDVVWTAGTNVDHTAGATVVDYASSTHISMVSKGILVHADQDGTLKTSAVQDALGVTTLPSGGWDILNSGTAPTIATGDTLGNRSFDLTFASVDLTSTLSPGMRIKLDRSVTPSDQCVDLEAGSSQYASKSSPSGITFTDDFTCEAWIKLESYTQGAIVSRYNGTTGWTFNVNSNGTVQLQGITTGPTQDYVTSYQSVPLNKWVHVAASLDMSGASGVIYIDGVSVPSSYTNAAPTALTQAGNLQVGAHNGTLFFDGKISDVRVWSDIRTATEIQDNMNQALVGNESNLVAYFKLNGDFTDETSNNNDMTGSGGAVATNADNPFNTTEYGIITKVDFSSDTTVNVFTPEGYVIPNETLTNPFYSTQKIPYGFPQQPEKWEVISLLGASVSTTTTANTWVNPGSWQLAVPTGSWAVTLKATLSHTNSSASLYAPRGGLSTSNSTPSDFDFYSDFVIRTSSTSTSYASAWISKNLSVTTQTPYYAIISPETGAGTITVGWTANIDVGDTSMIFIKAECAYL